MWVGSKNQLGAHFGSSHNKNYKVLVSLSGLHVGKPTCMEEGSRKAQEEVIRPLALVQDAFIQWLGLASVT